MEPQQQQPRQQPHHKNQHLPPHAQQPQHQQHQLPQQQQQQHHHRPNSQQQQHPNVAQQQQQQPPPPHHPQQQGVQANAANAGGQVNQQQQPQPLHPQHQVAAAAAAAAAAVAATHQSLPPQSMQQQQQPQQVNPQAQQHAVYMQGSYTNPYVAHHAYYQQHYMGYPHYPTQMATYPTPYRPPIGVAPTNTVAAAAPQIKPAPTTPAPKRQGIVIKDPTTGKVLDFKELSKTPATTNTTSNTAPQSAEAAQSFAQKVSEITISDKTTSDQAPLTNSSEVKDKPDNNKSVKTPEITKSDINNKPTTTTTTPSTTPTLAKTSDQTKSTDPVPTKSDQLDQNKQQDKSLDQKDELLDKKKNANEEQEVDKKQGQSDREQSDQKEQLLDQKQQDQPDESADEPIGEPGQFHPVKNRTGKRVYSKEFLSAICKKLGLEKVLDDDDNYEPSNHLMQSQVDPFAPSFARGRDAHRPNHNYSGRSSAGPDRPRKIITTTSYTQEVELKTVEKPWKPSSEAKADSVDPELAETELIKKKFRSILNKLTPNNFENLAIAVTDLKINTEAKLGDVIDIVFAKALAEPGYCVLYGQMCSHLKKITAGQANFGNTLLRRCQSQFQADIYAGLNLDERKEKIEKEENPEIKKQLNEELYEDMFRCRMRGLGLIKFIGELYKIEMLNDHIMFDCVLRLLQDTSEESLECLCDLLTTIGEKLDHSCKDREAEKKKAPKQTKNAYSSGQKSAASVVAAAGAPKQVDPSLDHVFVQLKKIREDNSLPLSLRIRFKILDTIDLRERHRWSSKKTKDNNPKKLDEIREAHMEQLEKEKRQLTTGRRSQEGRRGGGMGNPSGSSGQISSLANDSNRGGSMHTSASSQALRDYPTGDYRPNHGNDTVDHQKKLDNLKSIRSFLPTITNLGQKPSMDLRPVAFRHQASSGPANAGAAASAPTAVASTTTTTNTTNTTQQSATTTNKTS